MHKGDCSSSQQQHKSNFPSPPNGKRSFIVRDVTEQSVASETNRPAGGMFADTPVWRHSLQDLYIYATPAKTCLDLSLHVKMLLSGTESIASHFNMH